MNNLNQFIGKYKVEKTLRFELCPIGKTEEWMGKNGVIQSDRKKAMNYIEVKKLIDRYHKTCIRESLTKKHFDWTKLADAIESHRKSKNDESNKELRKVQTDFRNEISKLFPLFPDYEQLIAPTPSILVKEILPKCIRERDLPEFCDIEIPNNALEALSLFDGFALYFDGYQTNRKNLYSSALISSSVAYRVVHDNFPKFHANMAVYNNIKEICPNVISECANGLRQYLKGKTLDDVFTYDFYNELLTQAGIDLYNTIIGGVSGEEGTPRLQGLNELTNLYIQTHGLGKAQKKALTMVPLFKQILSDRETYSYIPEAIDKEEDLVSAISGFHHRLSNYYINGKIVDVLASLQDLLARIEIYDTDRIFVENKSLNVISKSLFDDTFAVRTKMADYLKGNGMKERDIKKFFKEEAFSISDMHLDKSHSLSKYFKGISASMKSLEKNWRDFERRNTNSAQQKYKDSRAGIELVRKLLDSYKDALSLCSVLYIEDDRDLDANFYSVFIPLYTELRNIIPLYSKARNFLSQKPTDDKKFLLKFGNSNCSNGWDEPKVKSVLIFRNNNKYLLGVVDNNNRSCLNDLNQYAPVSEDDTVEYLDYNQGGHMSQNVLTLAERDGKTVMIKGRKENGENKVMEEQLKMLLPEHIYRIRMEQSYKKDSPLFSQDDLVSFLDYYKERVREYYSRFNFSFKKSTEYESFDEFVEELESKAYSIKFVPTSYKHLMKLVNEGLLYLFNIKNKDFEPGAHGKKNLHSLYWEQLFSNENLENLVVKLNAKSTMFCRPQIVFNAKSHQKGSILLNKRDKNGVPIPEPIYQQLYQHANGKIPTEKLSDDAKTYLDKSVMKEAQYKIVKDKRYTKQKYFVHISITLNANAPKKADISSEVLEYIKDNPSANIIGIDRGERNLLYLTLINQHGEILEQKSLNIINGFDYHAKLEQREEERDKARKSWQTVGNIKDLKEGYLSAAIHEICTMMVKHNAIIVLEDLNNGFKRGRFKFEKQVYQLFEKMLIDKLNYLCSKNLLPSENGGILRGYQLAEKFVSFEKLTKQSGFIFYVRPDYTSTIDPVTGFVSHFNFKETTNADARKAFFAKMKRIEYCNGHIEFEFEYKKYKTKDKDFVNQWTVSSSGKRIVWDKDNKTYMDRYPTINIVQAFAKRDIMLEEGTDIKAVLEQTEDAQATELYKVLFDSFRLIMQMRNSNSETGDDYILSPAVVNGKQFCSLDEEKLGCDGSGRWISKLPVDADANGAYHIALKGLYMIKTGQYGKIENAKWFQFAAENSINYKKTT